MNGKSNSRSGLYGILGMFCVACVFLPGCPREQAPAKKAEKKQQKLFVVKEGAALLEKPDAGGVRVGEVAAGEELTEVSASPGWYQVAAADAVRGWIDSSCVATAEQVERFRMDAGPEYGKKVMALKRVLDSVSERDTDEQRKRKAFLASEMIIRMRYAFGGSGYLAAGFRSFVLGREAVEVFNRYYERERTGYWNGVTDNELFNEWQKLEAARDQFNSAVFKETGMGYY